jgi:hypothetical protein
VEGVWDSSGKCQNLSVLLAISGFSWQSVSGLKAGELAR